MFKGMFKGLHIIHVAGHFPLYNKSLSIFPLWNSCFSDVRVCGAGVGTESQVC